MRSNIFSYQPFSAFSDLTPNPSPLAEGKSSQQKVTMTLLKLYAPSQGPCF